MARLRPIKKLRQLTATALENWSAKRVQKFQQKAQHAEKAYMDGNASTSRLSLTVRKINAGEKAKRVAARHTTGWIGKTIRRVKGKTN